MKQLAELKQVINDWKVNKLEKVKCCVRRNSSWAERARKNAAKVNHTDELRLTYEKVQQIHAEL